MTKDINIDEFDYPLPDERIAKHPIPIRDHCKLLVAQNDGKLDLHSFFNLPDLLPKNALLIANNAKVINARLKFHKDTGAEIEIFLLEPLAPADYACMFQANYKVMWKCLIGNSKKWKRGVLTKKLSINGKTVTLTAERSQNNADFRVWFSWDDTQVTFSDIIKEAGFIPIPPYLNRQSESSDSTDYQTVYSEIQGSVAAPTAGLHFTPELFTQLHDKGIRHDFITLHVGAGTFRPVSAERIGDHDMHAEPFSISIDTLKSIRHQKSLNLPVVAVGTTSVRTLESIPYLARMASLGIQPQSLQQWTPYENPLDDTPLITLLDNLIEYLERKNLSHLTAQTSIMIAPGFKWRIVDAIITNFHQPKSTLLLLVASFLQQHHNNPSFWKNIYSFALDNGCRFLSYGDASLLFPQNDNA